ncbi:MAG: hypothetical protein HQL52_01175 [Magnetococcales bacterium]|nr:hypothetical protein [Magnetococcales bacterium]
MGGILSSQGLSFDLSFDFDFSLHPPGGLGAGPQGLDLSFDFDFSLHPPGGLGAGPQGLSFDLSFDFDFSLHPPGGLGAGTRQAPRHPLENIDVSIKSIIGVKRGQNAK